MTIDGAMEAVPSARVWPRWIASALVCWLGLVVAITAVVEPVSTVIVTGPAARIEAAILHADVRIVDAGPGFAIVSGTTAGFVGRLYSGGAFLVLPRRLGGCISRPQ